MKKLFKDPIYLLIALSSYVVLFAFDESWAFVKTRHVVAAWIFFIGSSFIVLRLVNQFLKNSKKTILLQVGLTLFMIFSAKLAYTILHFVGWTSFNYKLLLTAFFIVLLCYWYVILTRVKKHHKVVSFFSLLFTVLSLYLIVDLCLRVPSCKNKLEEFLETEDLTSVKLEESPTIIHVLFDGFTGEEGMKKYWDYSNEKMYNQLEARDFQVNRAAQSPYDNTLSSMSAVFNMTYEKEYPSCLRSVAHERVIRKKRIDTSLIPGFLQEKGYTVYNYSPFDLANNSKHYTYHLLQDQVSYYRYLFDMSLPGSLYKSLQNDETYKTNEEIITQLETTKFPDKSFVYSHLMFPHEPFNYLEDGTLVPNRSGSDLKSLYMDQYKYCSKKIIEMADRIIDNNPEAIILFQSDHGSRLYQNEKEKDAEKYYTLLAIRMPESVRSTNELDFNNINSYKYILNNIGESQMEMMPYKRNFFLDKK